MQLVLNFSSDSDSSENSDLLIESQTPKNKFLLDATEWNPPKGYGAIVSLPIRSIEVYG